MEASGGQGMANNGYAFNASGGTAVNPYAAKATLSVKEMEAAETQTITGKYNSVIIAKNINMDIVTFNRYNPLFDGQMAANGKYELILPQDKMQIFLSDKYRILNECVQMLLGEGDIPSSTTVYPAKYKRKSKVK